MVFRMYWEGVVESVSCVMLTPFVDKPSCDGFTLDAAFADSRAHNKGLVVVPLRPGDRYGCR
jgi:hypothetical protein